MTPTPIKRSQVLRIVRDETYALGAIARRKAEEDLGAVACGVGCSFCCHEKIVASLDIGIPIYLYLAAQDRWSPELRARLLEADWHMSVHDHAEYPRRPCPFLDKDEHGGGTCNVYPVRPLACATTFAREPKKCAATSTRNDGDQVGILLSAGTRRTLDELLGGLRTGLGEAPFVEMTLPGAVLWAEHLMNGSPRPAILRVPVQPNRTPEQILQTHRNRTVPFDLAGKEWAKTHKVPGSD